jgi:DNA invertase Pin-like site-specific DNA recombinase
LTEMRQGGIGNEAAPMVSNGKFVAYYRVSTDRQGRSGLGLEAQRGAVANYLNGGNWRIIAEFTEVESGRKSERPELDKALAAARAHRCPVVVSKVDRLTRSVAFLSRLLEANVDVRFADLPQIEGPTGRFMLQQMASVAELEAGMISARTRAALAAAKARGKKLGGPRIRKSNGKPVVISREAQMQGASANRVRAVTRAKDLAPTIAQIQAPGAVTLEAIADGLTAAGIPTPRGHGKWKPCRSSARWRR